MVAMGTDRWLLLDDVMTPLHSDLSSYEGMRFLSRSVMVELFMLQTSTTTITFEIIVPYFLLSLE